MKFLLKPNLFLVLFVYLPAFYFGMGALVNRAGSMAPDPVGPQAAEIHADPASPPFDGLDLTPVVDAPPSPATQPAETAPAASGPAKAPARKHVPEAAKTASLDELLTEYVRNFEALADATTRHDTLHQPTYLEERERLAYAISECLDEPIEQSTALKARAKDAPEAIEDLEKCLRAIASKNANI